ncbi:filamentous hemagglutinin N-terminal domain-containing protein [Arcobacter sp.]|uniref:two-partner secretion domain-containing protein n=1 Tax=Arcobacter sp. TaxID=1872629 RepID=UPI003D148BCC
MNRLIDFSSRFRILKGGKISLVVSALIGSATILSASPTGGTVTSGSAAISQSGSVTNITQSTQKASINWQSFSIAQNETVNFNQPNSSSITLNRVVGNESSVINGALNANGQVWILNSNGVLFGKNASINTAGLLATTAKLSDVDFQNGNYNFKDSTSNSVVNEGTITISDGGSVVLASNEVRNSGTIKAVKGKVHLVGASEYSINLNGNSLVNLSVDKGVLDAMVENSGTVLADGGEIYLTTNAVDELLKGVVNNTGIIEANSLDGLTGKVELFAHGGEVQVAGTITAKDGFIETSGKDFTIDKDTLIKAKTWLIDPTDLIVSDATAYETALGGGTDTLIQTNEGNIYINDTIDWQSIAKLTLDAYYDIYINQAITAPNGKLALYYGQFTKNATNPSDYHINAKVNLGAGENFITKLGYDGIETVWQVITQLGNDNSSSDGTLQGMKGSLNAHFVLGADIDALATAYWNGGAGWTAIGVLDFGFTGSFDGLGHTVDRLNIIQSSEFQGFFGLVDGGVIRNIGLTNVSIRGTNHTAGLVGHLYGGTISNAYVTGSVSAPNCNYIGGLVGLNENGIITDAYTTAVVNGGDYVGGLVGWNLGTITDSYASNLVTAGNNAYIGGLVGKKGDGSSITKSYYDTDTNSDTMSDSVYGKTKADILALAKANWDNDIWAVDGSSFNGYATDTLTLPQLVVFYTPSSTLFNSGYGTEASPYTIINWTQLQNINFSSNTLSGGYYFALSNNLDSSTNGYTTQVKDGDTLANADEGWNPIGNDNYQFTGNFDGLGHTIDQLTINRASSLQGLFGNAGSNSIIQNIGVTNVDIQGRDYVGGLAAFSTANISNSYSTGNISGFESVGGLVGVNQDYITNSYSTATVSGTDFVGGLVGVNKTHIINSYSTANVSGSDAVGGLVGLHNLRMGATINNSYAAGTITTSSLRGGLVGLLTYEGEMSEIFNRTYDDYQNVVGYGAGISNSYHDKGTNTETLGDSTLGKTQAQMESITTFSNWDITEDSTLDDSYKYPVLVTQNGETSWKIYKAPAVAPVAAVAAEAEIADIITPILNGTRIVIKAPQPSSSTPRVQTQTAASNMGLGNNARIVSTADIGETPNRVVSLGELQQANVGAGEVRVPLSDNSIVDLVNGGVNLPNGVEQQFFIVADNTVTEN